MTTGDVCPECGSPNITEVVITSGGKPRTITPDTPPTKICARCGHTWK